MLLDNPVADHQLQVGALGLKQRSRLVVRNAWPSINKLDQHLRRDAARLATVDARTDDLNTILDEAFSQWLDVVRSAQFDERFQRGRDER